MSLFSPFIFLAAVVFTYGSTPLHHHIEVDGNALIVGPQLSSTGRVILYTLDHKGTFHRSIPTHHQTTEEVTYSVLKNGILIAEDGPYAITYKINKRGDLVPLPSNTCIYKTDRPAFYLEGLAKMLIPVEIFYSGDHIYYVQGGKRLLHSEKLDRSFKNTNMIGEERPRSVHLHQRALVPDQACDGDIILFLLKSNGVFARTPPDEFIPNGMKLKYELQDNGALIPRSHNNGLGFTYITSENGNLQPCTNNTHTLTTLKETTKSFILGQGGVLAPVSEFMDVNKTVSYFFDGKLLHSSKQFREVYSNSSVLVLSENLKERNDTEVQTIQPGPKFVCPQKRISKRDTEVQRNGKESAEDIQKRNSPVEGRCPCAFDGTGRRIFLEPFFTDLGKIVLYKLTCQGHLKRLVPCKEPDYDFEVLFELLENLILKPVTKFSKHKLNLKFNLKITGSLVPVPYENTLKKAPASMCYFLLTKQKYLIPVRINILENNEINIYYQDYLIYTLCAEEAKTMELFTTVYNPLYVYCNGRIVVAYSDPVPKSSTGATWTNPSKSEEDVKCLSKTLYLLSPNGTKIKITPAISDKGMPCIYEMDWKGICHKSPKDDNKNMCFKLFLLLHGGILMQKEGSKGYMYLVDKHGNMCPYYYPETKLRAPFGQTVKYCLCEKNIYVPVLILFNGEYLQYLFEDTVIYCKKTWTLEQILELKQGDCPELKALEDIASLLYKDKKGNVVYFEKCGDVYKRHPPQNLEACLAHTMGYYVVSPSGMLIYTEHPDPESDYMQLMIEQGGDMRVLSTSANKAPEWKDYLLAKNFGLIPVEVKKKDTWIKFYKGGIRIYKQKIDDNWKLTKEGDNASSEAQTPSGKDPMGICKGPPPTNSKNEDNKPEYIQIPMKEVTFSGKIKCPENEKCKCEHMRKTIKEVMSKHAASNMEVEIPEKMMQTICAMANKCANIKTRSRRCARRRSRQKKVQEEDFC